MHDGAEHRASAGNRSFCRHQTRDLLEQGNQKEQFVGTAAIRSFRFFGILVEKAGPYLLLELLLPGGTLFALLLYAYRRQKPVSRSNARTALTRWSGRLLCQVIAAQFPDIASTWRGRHGERDGLEALAF